MASVGVSVSSAAQLRMSLWLLRPDSASRSAGSARTRTALSWLDRLGSGLGGGGLGQFEQPHHLHRPVTGLGRGGGPARQHRGGGGFGIDRVGLATPTPGGLVRGVDLDHLHAGGAEVAGQRRPVGAGASTPARRSKAARPGQQLLVAGGGRREAAAALHPTKDRHHCHDVHVLMGVDPDDHLGAGVGLVGWGWLGHAGHGRLPPDRLGNLRWPTPGRVGGQDCDGALCGKAPIGTRPPDPAAARTAPGQWSTDQTQGTTASRNAGQTPTRGGSPHPHSHTGSPPAEPLEPVDPALHRMPQPVGHPVEGRWPAALGAPGPPVGGLVILLRDGGPDATPAQQRAVGPGAVGLVGQHPVGPGAGTPPTKARHPDAAQHRRELGAVTALAGGQDDRQGPLVTFDGQMELAVSPPGAPECVVGRLDVDPARFFALAVPPLRAPAAC